MAVRSMHKKLTYEDKFDRKFWVCNRAKRSWVKFTKHYNNKKLRSIYKQEQNNMRA